MTTRPAFVFLREDGESASAAVARCARQAVAGGPMGRSIRPDDYRAFVEAAYAVDTPAKPVYASRGTHCAVFVRACLALAGVKPRGGRPRVTGITSWLGVGWFKEPEWVPVSKMADGARVGDVPYWCGFPGMTASLWLAALNGHVGVVLQRDPLHTPAGDSLDLPGWVHRTAEGGGAPDGSTCRMSAAPKDIRTNNGRPLRGVWRPDNMPVISGLGAR